MKHNSFLILVQGVQTSFSIDIFLAVLFPPLQNILICSNEIIHSPHHSVPSSLSKIFMSALWNAVVQAAAMLLVFIGPWAKRLCAGTPTKRCVAPPAIACDLHNSAIIASPS